MGSGRSDIGGGASSLFSGEVVDVISEGINDEVVE